MQRLPYGMEQATSYSALNMFSTASPDAEKSRVLISIAPLEQATTNVYLGLDNTYSWQYFLSPLACLAHRKQEHFLTRAVNV